MKQSQLNVKISPDLMRQLRRDAVKFRKTMDGVASCAFAKWFFNTIRVRAAYYDRIPDRGRGRTVKE